MRMTLVPYTKMDGVPTLKDSEIMELYDRMVADNVAETIFFDGQVTSREVWLDSVISGRNALYVVLVRDREGGPFGDETIEPAAACWLNNFNGKAAEMHWCVFSKFWNNGSAALIRFAADKLIHMRNDEEYVFDVLLGIIPVTNKRAIAMIQKAGAVADYVVPNALYIYREEKSVDGVLIHWTRDQSKKKEEN